MNITDLKQLDELLKKRLAGFATKKDIKNFARRQDLERFATKQDLERFATKQDLERFATKQDLDNAVVQIVEIVDKNKADREDVVQLEKRVSSVEHKLGTV